MPEKPQPSDEINDVHLRMWMHYDTLRQQKTATFLTANTILAAVVGLSPMDSQRLLTSLIALLGIVIGGAWLLLLTRNGLYIKLHRDQVGRDWTPQSQTPRSGMLDRVLPVAFAVFWLAVLIVTAIP